MKIIPLTRGVEAVIDDCDHGLILSFGWWGAMPRNQTNGGFYATTRVKVGARLTTRYMHREIMRAPKGLQVDHIDGNGLNNTRANLRLCDRSLNNVNRRLGYSPASGFRGVYQDRGAPLFYARIWHGGSAKRLGYFRDAQEAARAYDAAAREAFGEFAILNFPNRKVA